ncbi:MAG: hypothetical protein JNM43_16085 [Planctomycetaceae bacterium]|nr:hypothetical protein [Planctomycetaceae bacterium]
MRQFEKGYRDLKKLLGAPPQDYAIRNQRMQEILNTLRVNFAIPPNVASPESLKGTASLCANISLMTICRFRALAAWILPPTAAVKKLVVNCRGVSSGQFPLRIEDRQLLAFQSKLAIHRKHKKAGEAYIPSKTAEASFQLFWESFIAEEILTGSPRLVEQVRWRIEKLVTLTDAQFRATLQAAISAILTGNAPEGAFIEIWAECGLTSDLVRQIVRRHTVP